MRLRILLRQTSAYLLMRLEVRLLAFFAAVSYAVALQTLLERFLCVGFGALRACFWLLLLLLLLL